MPSMTPVSDRIAAIIEKKEAGHSHGERILTEVVNTLTKAAAAAVDMGANFEDIQDGYFNAAVNVLVNSCMTISQTNKPAALRMLMTIVQQAAQNIVDADTEEGIAAVFEFGTHQ